MENIDFTRMSSKGQVVVPKNIREDLNLKSGELFMIFADQDTLILKKIKHPNKTDLDNMFARSRKLAQEKGLTQEDVEKAIETVRNENRR